MPCEVFFVPNDRAIWQSDTAKTYQCPFCGRAIFSQYEGDKLPIAIVCHGLLKGHTLRWDELPRTA